MSLILPLHLVAVAVEASPTVSDQVIAQAFASTCRVHDDSFLCMGLSSPSERTKPELRALEACSVVTGPDNRDTNRPLFDHEHEVSQYR